MKQSSYELFEHADIETILKTIDDELQLRNESPIWKLKVVPFCEAILSVLIPMRDTNTLINPEGKKEDKLTPELFLRWSDFVSLKTLYFRMKDSDIDLKILSEYLAKSNVNLENEYLDFPISTYNLHQGVSNVIKSLL
jgi:hypothetical protein